MNTEKPEKNEMKKRHLDLSLEKALKDSEMLLNYATSKGLEIERETILTITNSKYIENHDKWNPENEAEFWAAFSILAKKVLPVTVESIDITLVKKASNPVSRFFGIENSKATIMVRNFTFWALIAIILVLFVQIMSLIGNNLLEDTAEIKANIKLLEDERAEYWKRSFEGSKSLYLSEIIFSGSKNKNSATDWEIKQINHKLWSLHTELVNTVMDLGYWFEFMVNAQALRNINDVLYYAYDDTISFELEGVKEEMQQTVVPPTDSLLFDSIAPANVSAKFSNVTENSTTNDYSSVSGQPTNLPRNNSTNNYVYTLTTPPEVVFSKIYPDIERIITAVRSPIDIMQIYLLPLLYGLIGAFVYVLRVFVSKMKAEVYVHEPYVNYLLRIFLGAIAGLTIRMFFFSTGDETGLAIYSPLALSFLTGYGVELLFSTMDRLIANVAKKNETNGKTSETSA